MSYHFPLWHKPLAFQWGSEGARCSGGSDDKWQWQIQVDSHFKLCGDPQWPLDTLSNRANQTTLHMLRSATCLTTAPVCFCLLFTGVLLYVVMRFAVSISSLEEMRTRSQASSLIRRCPVTAVSGIRTCGCRYPILHLCHSALTDQQSNFTQARSEGGSADAGMRIYASTKTRSCLKWLEGWWSGGRRWAKRIR